jgi:phosphate-selective porin OprO and OprP
MHAMHNPMRRLNGRCALALVLAGLCGTPAFGQVAPSLASPMATFGEPQAQDPIPSKPAPAARIPAVAPGAISAESLVEDMPYTSSPRRYSLGAYWDNGLYFESDDEQFRLHIGGTGQVDSVWFIGPQSLFTNPAGATSGIGNANGTLLRRARLRADGTIFGQFDYSVELDFANASNDNNSSDQPLSFNSLIGTPTPQNVWMQIRDVPVLGYVRAGYQDKPISMTNNTSASSLNFMERPDVMDAFYGPFDNGFALGVSAANWIESERLAWRYGIYRPLTNGFGVALNKYAYGGRVTALPWFEDDGRHLIHIGLGTWDGELVEDELRVRARPVLRNGPGFAVPVFVDTGEIPGANQYTFAPEFALVWDSLTIQAEWCGQYLTGAVVNNQPQNTVFYQGGYVEVLYFLTGEYQPYLKRDGVFGRVIPLSDYHLKKGEGCQGIGAWQVGARFSYLNLNDGGVQGGVIYDWTFGLNWFLNPNMKFQLNYILEHRNEPGVPVGWISGVGVRVAYDF